MLDEQTPPSHRYDKEGHSMEGQSLTETRTGGGGGSVNWKTLADVKSEHLGHGEKVRSPSAVLPVSNTLGIDSLLHQEAS